MYLLSAPFALGNVKNLRAFAKVRKELRKLRPIPDFYATQAELFAKKMDIEAKEAERIINGSFYGQWEDVLRRVKTFPHLRDGLQTLRDKGLRLAALSDFPVKRKLEYLRLENYWDLAFSSEEVSYLKPSPEPFTHILEHFSALPQEVLYVGNNYAYDIEGAAKQGMRTAHVTRFPRKNSVADFSFYDYRRLVSWILSIL
jgi:putative hydrolase of the HAD superfamily